MANVQTLANVKKLVLGLGVSLIGSMSLASEQIPTPTLRCEVVSCNPLQAAPYSDVAKNYCQFLTNEVVYQFQFTNEYSLPGGQLPQEDEGINWKVVHLTQLWKKSGSPMLKAKLVVTFDGRLGASVVSQENLSRDSKYFFPTIASNKEIMATFWEVPNNASATLSVVQAKCTPQ